MFKDSDIRASHRQATRGCGVASYGQLDTYGRRDESGAGVEPRMARLRREREEAFTLKDVGDRSKNHTGRLRWE